MATNARLILMLPGEEPKAVYLHAGHPLDALPMLRRHYSDPDRARALVELGDISYVAPRLEPSPGERHSFRDPAPGVTVAYHRDRREPWHRVRTKSLKEVPEMEFDYVFDGSEWTAYCRAYDRGLPLAV